ncbi:hypothetical protein CODIS_37970 [Candidatus Thiodiazotropha endolucinida]|uniref:Uncharacterized protein n=1 Tax=Candidatus Thiodiazotropha endolucinida TaxID=1655433 RepID=A0A7Z1ADL2_9GAMM|nr:hypothetical protein CODIS_37970 [Candidatus Thiodiazotropha endolucinida]
MCNSHLGYIKLSSYLFPMPYKTEIYYQVSGFTCYYIGINWPLSAIPIQQPSTIHGPVHLHDEQGG